MCYTIVMSRGVFGQARFSRLRRWLCMAFALLTLLSCCGCQLLHYRRTTPIVTLSPAPTIAATVTPLATATPVPSPTPNYEKLVASTFSEFFTVDLGSYMDDLAILGASASMDELANKLPLFDSLAQTLRDAMTLAGEACQSALAGYFIAPLDIELPDAKALAALASVYGAELCTMLSDGASVDWQNDGCVTVSVPTFADFLAEADSSAAPRLLLNYAYLNTIYDQSGTRLAEPSDGVTADAPTGLIQPVTQRTLRSQWNAVIDHGRLRQIGFVINATGGTPVCCAASASVLFAGTDAYYGNCLILYDANDWLYVYAFLAELPDVQVGETFTQGQTVGHVGGSGSGSDVNELFFGVISPSLRFVDPCPLLTAASTAPTTEAAVTPAP